jgi:hypothetical protein
LGCLSRAPRVAVDPVRDRNFPTTEGAYQRELKGEADAFVAKFTPAGTIVFATLIGGTKREHHTGLAICS